VPGMAGAGTAGRTPAAGAPTNIDTNSSRCLCFRSSTQRSHTQDSSSSSSSRRGTTSVLLINSSFTQAVVVVLQLLAVGVTGCPRMPLMPWRTAWDWEQPSLRNRRQRSTALRQPAARVLQPATALAAPLAEASIGLYHEQQQQQQAMEQQQQQDDNGQQPLPARATAASGRHHWAVRHQGTAGGESPA